MAKRSVKAAKPRAKKTTLDLGDLRADIETTLGFDFVENAGLHPDRANAMWKLLVEYARQLCEGECPRCVALDAVHERQKNCQECRQPNHQNFIVKDEVWAKTGLSIDGGTLHLACLEKRLGRPLTAEDFTNDRPNAALRFGHAMAGRTGKTGEAALSVIDDLLKAAFRTPTMHGNPRHYETWVCAQLDAWEAICRGGTGTGERVWFELWRAQCATAGRNQAQSLSTVIRNGEIVPVSEASAFELKRTYEEVTIGMQKVWKGLHDRYKVPLAT